MDISIREAVDIDLNLILSMMDDFNTTFDYSFNSDQTSKNLEHFISSEDLGRLWLILGNGDAIGYIVLAYGFSFEYGGRDAFIDEFFVTESFRGKGYGKKVLTLVSKAASDLGVRAIHLEVENDNEQAYSLYEQHGFQSQKRSLLTYKLK